MNMPGDSSPSLRRVVLTSIAVVAVALAVWIMVRIWDADYYEQQAALDEHWREYGHMISRLESGDVEALYALAARLEGKSASAWVGLAWKAIPYTSEKNMRGAEATEWIRRNAADLVYDPTSQQFRLRPTTTAGSKQQRDEGAKARPGTRGESATSPP